MNSNKACIIICYFGRLPDWFHYWLKSAELSGLDFLLVTDADLATYNAPNNLKIVNTSFSELIAKFSRIAAFEKPAVHLDPYKLCDFKPMYGEAFNNEISEYSHWGFGDVDLIFGNVFKASSQNLLDYDFVSFMPDRASGHLCLIRNTPSLKSSWRMIPNFPDLVFSPNHKGLDEHQWSGVFIPRSFRQRITHFCRRLNGFNPKVYAVNHGVTPHSNQPWLTGDHNYPTRFEWNNGEVISDDGYKLPYIHFMNWKSNKWRPNRYDESLFSDFSHIDTLVTDHFSITPQGIKSIQV